MTKVVGIGGDRGTSGIAMTMSKGSSYTDPVGDSANVLTQGGCMVLPIAYLHATWVMDSGSGKDKRPARIAYNPTNKGDVAWNGKYSY